MGLLIKLQNGDTALKSLKFGNDRPGGGSSNQPYIKNPIDRPDTPTLNSDFLLRGGISAPLNAAEDVARLTKYFFDFRNPSGLLFTAKQNILSRVAPKTEASFGPAYGGFAKDINPKTGAISQNQSNGFFNAGVYTPLSTIAEAGVVAFGGHLNKQGLDPTGLFPTFSIRKYGDIAFANNQIEKNAEDPKVPLALWRKSQNASNKAGRKLAQANEQDIKTKNELAVNASIPTTPNGSLAEFNKNSFAQSKLNQFLQKWDAYRDKQAIKKLNKKDNAASKALDKQAELFQQVQDAENAPKTYANRLLNLWNLNGLNPTNPFNSNSPILYSYSGGPDSTLGVGNTDIKFATLGDGLTPIRTNNIPFDDPSRPTVYYSTTNIFGDENSSVSLRYASLVTSTTDYDLFGADNYLETNNNTPLDRLGITTNPVSNNLYTNPSNLKTRNQDNTIYVSPINKILKSSGTGTTSGVSGSGRQLIADPQYILTSGSYLAVDPEGKILGQYSSEKTLWNDNLNQSSKDHYDKPKDHNKGYLANLDKNAGYYYDSGNLTFVINQYPRGIAPDFRLTSRGVRGFNDYVQSTRDGYVYGGYDAITKDPKDVPNYKDGAILDKIYYSSIDKRKSNPIDSGTDLIPFSIGIINPTTAEIANTLNFRAYIDSFSDSYSSEWKGQSYMGRAEKFWKYNTFDRTISLGFTIIADSKANLNIMYEQLNTLASSIAPTYTDQGYIAGNIHVLTVGNYVSGEWGVMDGITYEIVEESPWEIEKGNALPFYIRVSGISFHPIQKFRPQFNHSGSINQFINQ
jgi:hypothetical protein